jgi:hypothetical protein
MPYGALRNHNLPWHGPESIWEGKEVVEPERRLGVQGRPTPQLLHPSYRVGP